MSEARPPIARVIALLEGAHDEADLEWLVRGLALTLRDGVPLDPTIAAVANTSPASISYNAPSVTSTGATVANICTDIAACSRWALPGTSATQPAYS